MCPRLAKVEQDQLSSRPCLSASSCCDYSVQLVFATVTTKLKCSSFDFHLVRYKAASRGACSATCATYYAKLSAGPQKITMVLTRASRSMVTRSKASRLPAGIDFLTELPKKRKASSRDSKPKAAAKRLARSLSTDGQPQQSVPVSATNPSRSVKL